MWLPYAFLRFFLSLAAGILAAVYYPNFQIHILYLIIGAILLYLAATFFTKTNTKKTFSVFYGIFAVISIFLFGFVYTQFRTEKNEPTHFSRFMPLTYYEVVINSELQATKSGHKAEAILLKLATDSTGKTWQTTSGKLMIYFKCEDSVINQLKYGKNLIINGIPTQIMKPMNPEEFDYRNYMANLQINYYHFITEKDFVISGEMSLNPFWKYSFQARDYCDKVLRKFIPNNDAYGLATALVLGIKESLTDEVKNAYSNSGIMHILAVSGMHVTLLFQILMLGLKPLEKANPKTKFYVLILALIILWFYAFITGLSASVLRAVVMFTFMLGAEFLSRKPKIYNILAVSAFTMCLLNPYILFDVGFQLSYLAVLGIVFFHPLIYRFFTVPFPLRKKKEYKVAYWFRASPSYAADYAWQIICVSLAAQITTSPIALLYFHQFPNYFLIANLFAIPVSTIIMYLEIALLSFSWIHDYVGIFFGFLTQYSIIFLNFGVGLIEKAPFALTSGISIAAWETWLLYVVIVLFVLLFYFKKFFYFVFIFILLSFWSLFQVFEYFNHQKQQQIIFYQTPKVTAIELCAANQSIFIADDELLLDKNKLKFHTANYQFKRSISDILPVIIQDSILQAVDNQIATKYFINFPSKNNKNFVKIILETENFRIIVYRKHKILWLKKKIFIEAIPQADIWLITNNFFPKIPKLKQEKLVDSLNIAKPKMIIVNGSNKFYQTSKFKEFCLQYNLPCHFTAEEGSVEF